MTISRYDNRKLFNNELDLYENVLRQRSLSLIRQYNTGTLKYPDSNQLNTLNVEKEIWKVGDRLYKFADEYYGDVRLWWVIAWYNKKPTENHFQIGEEVLIPFPLDKLLNYFGV